MQKATLLLTLALGVGTLCASAQTTLESGLYRIKSVGLSKYLSQDETVEKHVTILNDKETNPQQYWNVTFSSDMKTATIVGSQGLKLAKGPGSNYYSGFDTADFLNSVALTAVSDKENTYVFTNVHSTAQNKFTLNNAAYNSDSNPYFLTTWNSTESANQYTFEKVTLADNVKAYTVSIEGADDNTPTVTLTSDSYTGNKTVYNGGVYYLTTAPETSNLTASSVTYYNMTGITVDGQTIKVTYAADYNALLAAEVTTAEALLANMATTIGYPSESARATLQAAITTAKAVTSATVNDVNTLKSAETAFSTTKDVVLPTDGKAYKMYGLFNNGTKVYLKHSDNTIYVVQKQSNGTFKFVSSTGDQEQMTYTGQGGNSGQLVTVFNLQARNRINMGALNLVTAENFTANVCIKSDGSSMNQYSNGSSNSGDWSTEWYFEEVPTSDFAGQTVKFVKSTDSKNYATLNLPYATTLPEGVTAYKKGEETATDVALVEYKTAGNVLPANTPVLLTATEEGDKTFAPAAYAASEDTGFKGTLGATAVTDANAYILAKKNEEVKFYALNSESNTVNANKAYLVIAASAGAQALNFNFGEVTGINQAINGAQSVNAPIYDLSGRRVMKAVKGGIYIQNGKKFVK